MINYYEYYDFFSGVEFGIPKAASDWPLCVFLFCIVCATHYRVPKRFLSLRRSNFVLEDAAKRSREIRGLICLTIVCIVSDD